MQKSEKKVKINDFSELDKALYPLTAPSKKYPKSLAVLQNIFWQVKHEKQPKDDLIKLLMYFSPKVRLYEETLSESAIFRMSAREYADLTGLSLKGAYTALTRAVSHLYDHSIIFDSEDRGNMRVRLVTSVGYQGGVFSVSFTHYALYMMSVFNQQTPFTKLQIKSIAGLYGHSLRLYPFLAQNAFRRNFEISLIDLKIALDLSPEAYSDYRDFKTCILKPHIDTINSQTELTVEFKAIKKEGRKASHINFVISEKKEAKKEIVKLEKSETEIPTKDSQEQAIAYVLHALSQRNLYHKFKLKNESNMQIMQRIREDMVSGNHEYWVAKLKEYTHSLPLDLSASSC